MMRTHLIRGFLVAKLIIVCGLVGGCTVQPKSRLNEEANRNIGVTHEQLRLRVRSMVDPMCGRIEHEADAIIAGTTDRNVQLAAIDWAIDAVPALREALYQPDPIIACADALTLCYQMGDYFETGPDRAAMGPDPAGRAAAASRAIAVELEQSFAAATKSGDIPRLRAFAQKWAADHPIQGSSIAMRESPLPRMAEFLSAEGLSTTETIAEVTTTLDDMNRKLEVYSSQLFRQARWEAQRMKLELIAELRLDQAIPLAEHAVKSADSAVATIDRLSPALDRSLTVAQDVPKLAASERVAAIDALHTEVARALEFVREERIATLAQVEKERTMAITDVARIALEQRKQIVLEADRIAGKQIDYAVAQVTRLLAVAMSAAVILAILGFLLIRRFPPRPRTAGGSPPMSTAPKRDS
jgi:hypothetical protein